MMEEIALYVDDYSFVQGYGQTNSLDTILRNIGLIDRQSLEEFKVGIEKIGGFTFAKEAGKYVCVAWSNPDYAEMKIYDGQQDVDKLKLEQNYRTVSFVEEIKDAFKKAKVNSNSTNFKVVIKN
jgi:hypothetical protein